MHRPHPVDVGLALALTALVQAEVLGTDVDRQAAAAAVSLAVTLPLAFARTAPLAVVAANTAGLVGLRLLDLGHEPQTVLLALFAAAFAAGAYASGRRAAAGLLVVWAGIVAQEAGDFIVLGPAAAGAWAAGVALRRHRDQTARLRELTEVLERERAEHARMAIEQERARIGRELHDVVAHSVSVMVVQAGAERLALGAERDQTRQVLAGIERTGRQALTEMRRLVGMLRLPGAEPDLAPLPGTAQLDALAQRMREAGLDVAVRREGRPVELPPGLDLTVFRIAQEGLTNALRHAEASAVELVLRYGGATVEVEVANDGPPAAEAARNGGGHGLAGMRERVALYGGTVEAGPGPQGGYRVHARLPLEVAGP